MEAVLERIKQAEEAAWINPKLVQQSEVSLPLSGKDIDDAEERLLRFAPFLQTAFPETAKDNGLIESKLVAIPKMQQEWSIGLPGRLLLKMDSHLPIAGSIKARGGIYEVLKHAEELALAHGILQKEDNYEILTQKKGFFSQYAIQVGSTGNLGMSIGIMSAALGFRTIVHMSADAKQWKKELLRQHGVIVKEYKSDYSEAVKQGRALSDADPMSYFVDDENSKDLFLGYAVAGRRLKKQLEEMGITIDQKHPLFVYLPCGVGGAPGGVTFGLKEEFGDCVHCFFIEPTQAPCMLAGMVTGLHEGICVQDLGLTGMTQADGLAVGRPSGFVGKVMEPLLSGAFTIQDEKLNDYLKLLYETEDIFLEPSACAAFQGPAMLMKEAGEYVKKQGLEDVMGQAVHIAWATGGSLVPEEIRKELLK